MACVVSSANWYWDKGRRCTVVCFLIGQSAEIRRRIKHAEMGLVARSLYIKNHRSP